MVHSWATDVDNKTVQKRWGRIGKQKIVDEGPLPPDASYGEKYNMETIDNTVRDMSLRFMEDAHKEGKPFFVWVNPSRAHVFTHLSDKYWKLINDPKSNYGLEEAAMAEFDDIVGAITKKLKDMGVEDNTIIIVTTDNGAEIMSWPDGGMTPFRGEKGMSTEGGFRSPAIVRWPGKIPADTVQNGIMSGMDWFPTLVAAAGNPNIIEELKKGKTIGGKQYKVHLDGYNFLSYLTGKEKAGPRKEIFYFSDDGDLIALRHGNWKMHFKVQDQPGTMEIWQREFRDLRLPYLFNLKTDPYEQATITSNEYWNWYIRHVFLLVPAQEVVGNFLATFKEYPPRQKAASFTIDQVLQKMQEGHGG